MLENICEWMATAHKISRNLYRLQAEAQNIWMNDIISFFSFYFWLNGYYYVDLEHNLMMPLKIFQVFVVCFHESMIFSDTF